MDLKFTFGDASPLPLTDVNAGSPGPGQGSARLELHVSLAEAHDGERSIVCVGRSGDGVEYARSEKPLAGTEPGALAAAIRSVLARAGAELPEPLLGSVTAIAIDLTAPGSSVDERTTQHAALIDALGLSAGVEAGTVAGTGTAFAVNEPLQARTGVAAGTPIRFATTGTGTGAATGTASSDR